MSSRIYKFFLRRFNSYKYAKKTGVNFLSMKTYGRIDWGTEPWIINIGRNVHLTDGVKFITHDGGTLLFRDKMPDLDITNRITIGDNVYIGNNVILLPGITIGSNVIIGAGAVVSKDIPSNSVAVGVPAKVIESIDEYYLKAQKKSTHLGHLKSKEKDDALKEFFNYCGKNKGIYF